MRILFLSTSYPCDADDWRGVFIRQLASGLARNAAVSLDVWAPPGELPSGARPAATMAESRWLAELMSDGGIAHLLRKGGISGARRAIKLLWLLRNVFNRDTKADLYHINWLQTAVPLPATGKPALITVLGTDLRLLELPGMAWLLRRAMRGRRVAICPNAEWMRDRLEGAFGRCARIEPVPFGIDQAWYSIERAPRSDAPIWIAVTRLTEDKLGPLFEWSAPLFSGSARRLHLFGPMQETIRVPEWAEYHGPATPRELSSKWFPRAHGLITLSRHAEGRPQVMLEAMAAGMPIIASYMPAHAGLVQDGTTGVLCRDQAGYALAIRRLEDDDVNFRFGAAAREWVNREIGTWDHCAERYLRLYRWLLAQDDG